MKLSNKDNTTASSSLISNLSEPIARTLQQELRLRRQPLRRNPVSSFPVLVSSS
jgi:hypothetical protein